MSKITGFINGYKGYTAALILLVAALLKYFVPESPIDLLDLNAPEGQGFAAYLIWAFRSALKKIEPK